MGRIARERLARQVDSAGRALVEPETTDSPGGSSGEGGRLRGTDRVLAGNTSGGGIRAGVRQTQPPSRDPRCGSPRRVRDHDHPLPSGGTCSLRIDERREGGHGAPQRRGRPRGRPRGRCRLRIRRAPIPGSQAPERRGWMVMCEIICAGRKLETVRLLGPAANGFRVASCRTEALLGEQLERKVHEVVRPWPAKGCKRQRPIPPPSATRMSHDPGGQRP